MKAVICEKYGSLDHIKIKQIEIPTITDDEILIKTMVSTVSRGDCVVRNASNPFMKMLFGFSRPRQPILGTELAGVVEQVGEKVTEFKIGDRVVASVGTKFGGHAEYIALKQDLAISTIPSALSFDEAVSLPFGGNAALHFLRKMEKKKDSSILIYGASGAVGTASVQIAKIFGFNVTAVCSSANRRLMYDLGIYHVFDYAKPNWRTGIGKFDYIFDAVGITTKKEWNVHLNSHGQFYSIAKGLVKPNLTDLEFLLDLASEEQIKPVIDRVYAVEKITDAYTYVETKRKKGNVLLDFI